MPDPKYKEVPPEVIQPKPDHGWFEDQVRELGPGHEFKPTEETK